MAAVPPGFRVDPHPHALPASPPRAVPSLDVKVLPTGLLAETQSSPPQTPSPPALEKKQTSFDDTTVKEFFEWVEGRRECLSPLASSDLGFDQWTYELRKKRPPSPGQEDRLKRRIWELANNSPLKLWHAIELCQLRELLGPGFEWVQTPQKW